jgi:hypothetical protein
MMRRLFRYELEALGERQACPGEAIAQLDGLLETAISLAGAERS